jgi:hypothetical protein
MPRHWKLKTRFLIALAVTGLGLALPGGALGANNVVPNPGFEEGGCLGTPIICGWHGQPLMTRGNGHSGNFALSLNCDHLCFSYPNGWAWLSAHTVPQACAVIGSGNHPASVWYGATGGDLVGLDAAFFQTRNCTGTSSGDRLEEWAPDPFGWHELTGSLTAPPGTRSALFSVFAGEECVDYCSIDFFEASFDDLDVEDTTAAPTGGGSSTVGPPRSSVSSLKPAGEEVRR